MPPKTNHAPRHEKNMHLHDDLKSGLQNNSRLNISIPSLVFLKPERGRIEKTKRSRLKISLCWKLDFSIFHLETQHLPQFPHIGLEIADFKIGTGRCHQSKFREILPNLTPGNLFMSGRSAIIYVRPVGCPQKRETPNIKTFGVTP